MIFYITANHVNTSLGRMLHTAMFVTHASITHMTAVKWKDIWEFMQGKNLLNVFIVFIVPRPKVVWNCICNWSIKFWVMQFEFFVAYFETYGVKLYFFIIMFCFPQFVFILKRTIFRFYFYHFYLVMFSKQLVENALVTNQSIIDKFIVSFYFCPMVYIFIYYYLFFYLFFLVRLSFMLISFFCWSRVYYLFKVMPFYIPNYIDIFILQRIFNCFI